MRENIEDTYKKWWLNKYLKDGKRIIDLKFIAPPSGIYGVVVLYLSDGSDYNVSTPAKAFRPRKKDLEVFDESPVGHVKVKCGVCGEMQRTDRTFKPSLIISHSFKDEPNVCSIECARKWWLERMYSLKT